MATLEELYKSISDDLRNRITAAGWNKAKDIIVDPASTPTQLKYARDLLESDGTPFAAVVHAVLVLIQNNDDPTDAEIQTAVGSVVDKFAELEA